MKRIVVALFLLSALVMLPEITAAESEHVIVSKGFPLGPHYTLNMIEKASAFVCPESQFVVDETGNFVLDERGNPIPIYGNVVYVPENKEDAYPVAIDMEWGLQENKVYFDKTKLQATDWCTGFTPNDAARIRLPNHDSGYAVYARVLGRQTENRKIEICDPGLTFVEAEDGINLLYLGLVKKTGYQTPAMSYTHKIRTATTLDITGLFQWSGEVCYLTRPEDGVSAERKSCAMDTDSDGVFDDYYFKKDNPTCEEGYREVTLYCKTYENTWLFNIADFIEYFWNVGTDDFTLIQIRFYPL